MNYLYCLISSPGTNKVVLKVLLLFVLLLFFVTTKASAGTIAFVNGTTQSMSVCQNAGATNINTLLTANDNTAAEVLTWSVNAAPPHGSLTGFNVASISIIGNTTPAGLTYTPSAGYSGNDTFTIKVSNGSNNVLTTIVVTVKPLPVMTAVGTQAICNNNNSNIINFSSSISGSSFTWTNNTTAIGLPASGSGSIGTFTATNSGNVPDTAIVTVSATANGCTGNMFNFNVIANPTPSIYTVANQTLCNGGNVNAINFSGSLVNGTTYLWTNTANSIGLPSSGIGNIASFLAINSGTSAILANITVTPYANNCPGNSAHFSITVNAVPDVVTPNGQIWCNNTPVSALNFTGSVAGTIYNWTNSNTSTGLPLSGSGSLPAFTIVDTGLTPVTASIGVTPLTSTCTGTTAYFNITVNPTPTVFLPVDQALCNNTPSSPISFSGLVGSTTYAWTNSDPGIGLGISSTGNIGSFIGIDTSTAPDTTMITVTPSAYGCGGSSVVFKVIVNPTPKLISSLTPPSVCDSTIFSYIPASATSGTTYSWSRGAVAGISNAAASGINNPFEVLHDTTDSPVVVIYVDTLTANNCRNTQAVIVTVNPTPKLSSTLTPPGICNNSLFTYNPHSTTLGTTFSWQRDSIPGISNHASYGTNNPNETLINTTANPLLVVYVDTLKANGCVNTEMVVVSVNPTPELSSAVKDSVCSGLPFIYTATSLTNNATFSWTRASVSGITPTTGSGTVHIHDTLVNSSNTNAATVVYHYALGIYGCTNTEDVTLSVNPNPAIPGIDTKTPSTVCANTLCQNFGAASAAPAGTSYSWSCVNALIWNEGSGKQYCLISFPNEGASIVTLTSTYNNTNCKSSTNYTVNVGSNANSRANVTYFNNHFVCLDNTADSYQWGYDDAASLDSTIILNAITQNYYNPSPDLVNKHYWVLFTKNGCTQKDYYNAPPEGTANNAVKSTAAMNIYPNPATGYVNIELSNADNNAAEINVYDVSGRKLINSPIYDKQLRLNISQLPVGVYMIVCTENGAYIASSRMIKN